MSVAEVLSVTDAASGDAPKNSAVARSENDPRSGATVTGGSTEISPVSDPWSGAPARHIDLQTALLDRYARSWIDLQQTRKALAQRHLPEGIVAEFARLEQLVSGLLKRTLRQHPLWPWLSQLPGLGGAHTALVIGRIGDPRRFPGQRCSEGHYLPPLYPVGSPCPVVAGTAEIDREGGDGADSGAQDSGADDDDLAFDGGPVCPGTMLPPRTTTGVRSLWHWAGVHVEEDGRAPRKRKGVRCSWEPRVRASVMQPGGIAEQIVRLSVPHYSDIYREQKARLMERVEGGLEIEQEDGTQNGRTSVRRSEIEKTGARPLRPFEADRIARKIAAKAFLADLLVEWKGLVASVCGIESDATIGGRQQ